MAVRVSTAWTYYGLRAVVLENTLLRVILLPQLGGKIWQITYKPADRDLLWQHPRITPRVVPFHAAYDDVFFGGWDEYFRTTCRKKSTASACPITARYGRCRGTLRLCGIRQTKGCCI